MNSINIKNLARPATKKHKASNTFDFLNKDIKFFSSGLSDKHKESFYNELHILMQAGLDLCASLEMIEYESSKKELATYRSIKESIISGCSLSEAQKNTGQFSPYEYFSIQIGEETGKLPVILKDLSNHYHQKIKQKRQIISALSYPVIVLCLALGAVVFMLYFIVPMFSDIFARFNGDLPALTKVIMEFSKFISSYIHIIGLAFTSIFISLYTQKDKQWFKKHSSTIVLKIPVVGEIIRKIQLARFCSMMYLLIGAKVHLVKAIGLVNNVTEFYPIKIVLPDIEIRLIKGESLSECLKSSPIFESKMVALIKVGEEVNQLEDFFYRIAEQYSDEIDHKTKILGSLVEPLLLLFLGGIVGLILIAMYLPLFKLSSSFG